MLMALSGYESPMLPKHVFGTGDIANHPNANKPVGTGPFKFVEWQKGQYMRFDRNGEYWRKGTPYLDRIVARFIADGATRAAAMETQEVLIGGFGAILPLDVKRLQALPHIAVTTRGYEMQSPIIELDFNTQKKPFDNAKVRQAVAYAIDRKFGNGLCAPIVPFVREGNLDTKSGHMGTPGTISMRPASYEAMLTDIVDSFRVGGFENIARLEL
jgi:peptide/nickel transport system substrate-binding protein